MRTASLLLLILLAAGCQTNASKQREEQQLQAAYLAGQQSSQLQFQQPQLQQPAAVNLVGEVRKNQIFWRPGLTLAEAIVEADYVGFLQPRAIVIVRGGARYEIDTPALLSGESNPEIHPGDIIDLRR